MLESPRVFWDSGDNSMILKVQVDDQLLDLSVPEDFLARAQDFFDGMDRDMDRGWQVNRQWVDQPDTALRALIAADKLLTALENRDDRIGRLMAGYIVSRVPQVTLVELNPMGEVRDHIIHTGAGRIEVEEDGPFSHDGLPAGLTPDEAAAQASLSTALSAVFGALRTDERGADELVAALDPAPGAAEAARRLQRAGWDIVVASAGCAWYIERLLQRMDLDSTVYATPGRFEPGAGLVTAPDPHGPFFHPVTGIDKAAVVRAARPRRRIFSWDGQSRREQRWP